MDPRQKNVPFYYVNSIGSERQKGVLSDEDKEGNAFEVSRWYQWMSQKEPFSCSAITRPVLPTEKIVHEEKKYERRTKVTGVSRRNATVDVSRTESGYNTYIVRRTTTYRTDLMEARDRLTRSDGDKVFGDWYDDGYQESTESYRDETVTVTDHARIEQDKLVNAFRTILVCLSNITPGSSNRSEWAHIRQTTAGILVNLDINTTETKFRQLLQCLSGINPGHDNRAEWSAIRNTCNNILRGLNSNNLRQGLRDILSCFTGIFPGHDNQAEWGEIRRLSHAALAGL